MDDKKPNEEHNYVNVVSLCVVENKFDVSKYNTANLHGRMLTTCIKAFIKLLIFNLLIPGDATYNFNYYHIGLQTSI